MEKELSLALEKQETLRSLEEKPYQVHHLPELFSYSVSEMREDRSNRVLFHYFWYAW